MSTSSSIVITKGLPISLLFGLKQSKVTVNLNDGTWDFEISLRHKTERGKEPFAIVGTPAVNAILVELSPAETDQLDYNDNDYVFVVKASKTDGTVNLRNVLQARVINDL